MERFKMQPPGLGLRTVAGALLPLGSTLKTTETSIFTSHITESGPRKPTNVASTAKAKSIAVHQRTTSANPTNCGSTKATEHFSISPNTSSNSPSEASARSLAILTSTAIRTFMSPTTKILIRSSTTLETGNSKRSVRSQEQASDRARSSMARWDSPSGTSTAIIAPISL